MIGLEHVVVLGVAVLLGNAAGERYRIAPPVVLLVLGALLGFVPALREVELPPEAVLLIFLPVLLYWESLTTSLREIRRDLRGIILMSTLLVIGTAGAVAVVAHELGLAWGPAWVLGAAVAPTDATAVGVLAKALPRRNVTLQGLLMPAVVRWARLPRDTSVEDERLLAETTATEEASKPFPRWPRNWTRTRRSPHACARSTRPTCSSSTPAAARPTTKTKTSCAITGTTPLCAWPSSPTNAPPCSGSATTTRSTTPCCAMSSADSTARKYGCPATKPPNDPSRTWARRQGNGVRSVLTGPQKIGRWSRTVNGTDKFGSGNVDHDRRRRRTSHVGRSRAVAPHAARRRNVGSNWLIPLTCSRWKSIFWSNLRTVFDFSNYGRRRGSPCSQPVTGSPPGRLCRPSSPA